MSFKQLHGSTNLDELADLSLNIDDIADFSSNCCPYSLFSDIKPPNNSAITHYPDISNRILRQGIASITGHPRHKISLGNGATELIWAIARAFLTKGDRVLILAPTFSEYESASRLMGAEVELFNQPIGSDFNSGAFCETISRIKPRLVFICNPNNPTGTLVRGADLQSINEATINNGGLLIIDEAYAFFVEENIVETLVGAITLRSMTKDYAIPGLRLGYTLSTTMVAEAINEQLPPWNINALAQYYGSALIEQYDKIKKNIARTRRDSVQLMRALKNNGWEVIPSKTHYFLVKVSNAQATRHALLIKHQINVRDCTSFGLPKYIRISPQLPAQNERLATIAFTSLTGGTD